MNMDQQLQHAVLRELAGDPAVEAKNISVEVNQGAVTLKGLVGSFYEKWQAERAAQRVPGVQSLAIDLQVNIASDRQRSDADIALAAEKVLSWNAAIPPDSVKVKVENGEVTLTGALGWNFQRETAQKIVAQLIGVVEVNNQIEIKPHVSSVRVKDDIDEAIKRQAIQDAAQISVRVEGSKVILEGSVSNWAERDVIKHTVWSTRGVQSVVDNLKYDTSRMKNF